MEHYFVRVGTLAEIRLASALIPLERGRRVVVRSARGVEIAEVVSRSRGPESRSRGTVDTTEEPGAVTYRVLRPTTDSDELLVRRLQRYKREAMESCRARLVENGCTATLLDVDQLLDGGTLVMHFLGEMDRDAQKIANEVSRQYEQIVRTDELAELLSEGCGPSCGSGGGCGESCGSCVGCAH